MADLKIIKEEVKNLLKLLKVEAKMKLRCLTPAVSSPRASLEQNPPKRRRIKTESVENEAVEVSLESEDSGILIGRYGQTLDALELILNLLVAKKLGEWRPIYLNVGDWRQKREEALQEMAKRTVEKVKITGQPATLPYLTSKERRIIHLFLHDHPEVTSSSFGEGEERRVIIQPRA